MNCADFLVYDVTSPSFLRWKISPSRNVRAGSPAGHFGSYHGYYRVKFGGQDVLAHRIVWVLHNGPIPQGMQIDHIDGDRTNNDVRNLRLASVSQNLQNQKCSVRSTSGVKGLRWAKSSQLWEGSVQYAGRRVYHTSADRGAVERWLVETRVRLHGQFARHA